MESFVFLPIMLTYLTVLSSSLADDTVVGTPHSSSSILKSNDDDHKIVVIIDTSDAFIEDTVNSLVDIHVGQVQLDSCADGVYLFKDWTSSTGLLFSVLLLYIGLVTITNVIVVYKFITTWNQITVSLREQNRVCAKYSNVPSMRRQTCHEALKPFRYNKEECAASAICPICLFDVKNQDFVVSCEGGCQTTFHKNCLYDWLEFKGQNDVVMMSENNASCPCCRKEMMGNVSTGIDANTTTSTSGFISELSTLVGYYPY